MFSFADQDRDGKIREDDQDKNLQTGLLQVRGLKVDILPAVAIKINIQLTWGISVSQQNNTILDVICSKFYPGDCCQL